MKNMSKTLQTIWRGTFAVLFFVAANTVVAQSLPDGNATSGIPTTDKTVETSVAEKPIRPVRPIALGAEIGANIDLSGTESSCFDIDIYAGYRKGMIQCAGVGIGVHPSFAHKRMFIPVYAMFRCNFKPGKSLCFFDVKAGMSINELAPDVRNTGVYASGGIGFNLASTRQFGTYAIVGYNFTQITPFSDGEIMRNEHALHAVSIRIGITF